MLLGHKELRQFPKKIKRVPHDVIDIESTLVWVIACHDTTEPFLNWYWPLFLITSLQGNELNLKYHTQTLIYWQISSIRHTLVGNKIVHHLDVVGALPNYISILNLTPGFNVLGKDNCKTRRETFKFGNLVWLILEIWGYVLLLQVIACHMFPSEPNLCGNTQKLHLKTWMA